MYSVFNTCGLHWYPEASMYNNSLCLKIVILTLCLCVCSGVGTHSKSKFLTQSRCVVVIMILVYIFQTHQCSYHLLPMIQIHRCQPLKIVIKMKVLFRHSLHCQACEAILKNMCYTFQRNKGQRFENIIYKIYNVILKKSTSYRLCDFDNEIFVDLCRHQSWTGQNTYYYFQ